MQGLPRLEANQTGSVMIAATLPRMSAMSATQVTMRLTLDGMVREAILDGSGGQFAGELRALPVGDWTVTVEFFDHEGDVTHVATGIAPVRTGSTTALHLEAVPKEGRLELTVDIGQAFADEGVQGARLTLTGGRYTTLEQSEEIPTRFTGSREMPPGDHDFAVTLYGESFLAKDRIYQSPWESVRIEPGKTVYVTWDAMWGDIQVVTRLITAPQPPSGLTLVRLDAETLRLAWQPSADPDVATYRIYSKEGDFAAYTLVGETTESYWEISAAAGDPAARASTRYVVTAQTADGRESYRTPPVSPAP